ncbi:MAG: DUF2236 domain-containing protein [Pseudomonadales bacterium]|nr:DUF2236 domain-containing protein [Pseudomonadales bacterium]
MTAAAQFPSIPTRARPFDKTQAKTPLWLKTIIGRDMSPTREEYDNVTAALHQGDPAMDALIDWMYEIGPREARKLYQQAMDHGVDSIPDAPQPLRDFFASVDFEPAWLDRDLIEEGVRFIHSIGLNGLYVLRDLALMGGYLLSGFNQSLVMTGALNKGTAQRVAETGKWWMDCTEPKGLERFGPGFKTTLQVRMVHGLVRRNLSSRDEWNHQVQGLPLNQIDMVATYLGFSVVMLGGLRKLGVPVTRRESKAVMHLWSYACWIMGVEERWLTFKETEAMVLLNHTFMTQSRPDWTSRELGEALSLEPLERHFNNFSDIRRQFAYQQHLSVSQYFLGTEKMKQLGLPANVLPWYPLLTIAPRFANYSSQHFVPLLRKRQEKTGRAAQKRALKEMFGEAEHAVIDPSKDHPAHL